MVGLCGTIGTATPRHERLRNGLEWRGDEVESTHTDDLFSITAVSHRLENEPQPVWTSDRDAAIWLWGSVWGFDSPADGEYLRPDEPSAAYCASLYEAYGADFVSGLNGNFVGVLYDHTERTITFFTDRLGTRPLHYVHTDDGLVFSTDIQSLPAHPAVDTDFDLEYLAEYFALKRSFGVKTPLEGVELLQPGSRTTVSLDDDDFDLEVERYWRPVHRPIDRPASYFAARLAELVRQAALERTDPETEYGVLLSGGSDSRLLLAALASADRSIRTYHINDWRNEEFRLARRVARTADVEFTFLERDADYQARALATTPTISTFGGYFNQAHAVGFQDKLDAEVDLLFTGHYGDMLFKGNHLATPTVDLGDFGSFELPTETPVTTVDEFVEHRAGDRPAYLADSLDRSVRDVYAANVARRGSRIVDHGVEYESLREATLCSRCPLTNGTSHFFYHSTLQMLPSATLFLDNRLIDLFLTIPIRHLLRGDLINRAIADLRPELADIPHGDTGVPLKYPFALQWAGTLATSLKRRYSSDPPEAHWTQGPWPDHNELIRTHGFIGDTIEEREDLIRRLPFLRWDGVLECYEDHLQGANNLGELYTLATFLNMPVTTQLA